MSATQAAVELRGVTKTFGGTTAVANLDLTVARGALYGFIGPNGAGKTTSIRTPNFYDPRALDPRRLIPPR